MTVVRVLAHIILTLAAGAGLAGLPRSDLRLTERMALAAILGTILSATVTFVLAVMMGMTVVAVLGGPAILLVSVAALALSGHDPRPRWAQSWHSALATWRDRRPWAGALATVLAAAALGVLFGHALFMQNGDLMAGYQTVWADWAQHLTTASSFAVAGNVPPVNPIFSGTPLLYPYMPDFHSAELMVLGVPPSLALGVPGAVLGVVIGMLVVSIVRRLGGSLAAGILAVAICFIGGGLGFTGILADSCTHHAWIQSQSSDPSAASAEPTYTNATAEAQGCSVGQLLVHPDRLLGALHDLPGMVKDQPRAYDGLLTDPDAQAVNNTQWYTPMMAWWLPQRSIDYGFAMAAAVLVLVLAGLETAERDWDGFILAGLLTGMLPLYHVHSLMAMAVLLAGLAAFRWRREWLMFGVAAAALGLPRMLQLAQGPHGSATSSPPNNFPTIKLGWMYAEHGGHGLIDWLGFWWVNLGLALPLCFLVVVAWIVRFIPGPARAIARAALAPFPSMALRVCLPLMVVFAAANVVVTQTWDWDNTKLLSYWYFGAAILIGLLAEYWWRRSLWTRLPAAILVLVTLASGSLVMLRLLPWTPAEHALGPYTSASAEEIDLARQVVAHTPANAVVMIPGRHNDPVTMLAGRTVVVGYWGWLWSYGTIFGSRLDDAKTLYAGCANIAPDQCPVSSIVQNYGVDFVEVDDRIDNNAIVSQIDVDWWKTQHYPVVAQTDHISVYDVRHQ